MKFIINHKSNPKAFKYNIILEHKTLETRLA